MNTRLKGIVLSAAVLASAFALPAATGSAGHDNARKMWGYMLHMTSNNWSERPSSQYETDYYRNQSFRTSLLLDERSWRRIIDELAAIGANTIMIDVEDGMRYDSHPEIAIEGSWPKDKLRAEVQRLKKLGFSLIPKLNFSATHDTWLKDWQDKLGTEEYRKMCGELIDEVCDVFGRPALFHVGMDEETPELKAKWGLRHVRQGETWWTDFLSIVAAVERNGARACTWSSSFAAHKDEFIRRCPHSVVIALTHYKYGRVPLDLDDSNMRLFKDVTESGFDILVGGSNWACEENFREIVAWCERHLDRTRILGYLMLPWQVTIPEWDRANLRAVDYLEDAMLQVGAKLPPNGKRQPFAAWVNRLSDGRLDRTIYPEDRRIILDTEEVVYDFGDTTGRALMIDLHSFSKKDETITVCYSEKLDGTRLANPEKLADFVVPPGEHRIAKPGFVFPKGRYVSITQTRQIHYTRLALIAPDCPPQTAALRR